MVELTESQLYDLGRGYNDSGLRSEALTHKYYLGYLLWCTGLTFNQVYKCLKFDLDRTAKVNMLREWKTLKNS